MKRVETLGCLFAVGLLTACGGAMPAPPPEPPPPNPVAIDPVAPDEPMAVAGDRDADGPEPGGSDDVSGSYAILVGESGAGQYTGDVTIRQTGDAYRLAWQLEDGAQYGGVGIRVGDLLGVGWGQPAQHGVVVYQIEGGHLNGKWATSTSGTVLGTENLTGSSELRGEYQIVLGQSPDASGAGYSGTVKMSKAGEAIQLEWHIQPSGDVFRGIGIRRGNVLVVGWGDDSVGSVVYEIASPKLKGVWVTGEGGTLGREVLGPPRAI